MYKLIIEERHIIAIQVNQCLTRYYSKMLIFPSPVKRAPVIVVWCAAPIILHPKAKPFVISKWRVMCAFELVKANTGAAGIDK